MEKVYRTPNLIRQEIRELEKTSQGARQWLDENPDDKVVSVLVEQYQSRTRRLHNELKESLETKT